MGENKCLFANGLHSLPEGMNVHTHTKYELKYSSVLTIYATHNQYNRTWKRHTFEVQYVEHRVDISREPTCCWAINWKTLVQTCFPPWSSPGNLGQSLSLLPSLPHRTLVRIKRKEVAHKLLWTPWRKSRVQYNSTTITILYKIAYYTIFV